jgi:hypothetical protein
VTMPELVPIPTVGASRPAAADAPVILAFLESLASGMAVRFPQGTVTRQTWRNRLRSAVTDPTIRIRTIQDGEHIVAWGVKKEAK